MPKSKKCPPGKIRNPATGRCVIDRMKPCPPGKVRNQETNRCHTPKSPKRKSPKKVSLKKKVSPKKKVSYKSPKRKSPKKMQIGLKLAMKVLKKALSEIDDDEVKKSLKRSVKKKVNPINVFKRVVRRAEKDGMIDNAEELIEIAKQGMEHARAKKENKRK